MKFIAKLFTLTLSEIFAIISLCFVGEIIYVMSVFDPILKDIFQGIAVSLQIFVCAKLFLLQHTSKLGQLVAV